MGLGRGGRVNIAIIIVGIDGWEEYTDPLLQSIWEHEAISPVVVDNASKTPYRTRDSILRTERLCYSAAINAGKAHADRLHGPSDWYIVLSNDVLCTGPFAHMLATQGNVVAGPQIWREHGLAWIVGWCVCIPRAVWDALGGWDENYIMSSWEDVDLSMSANEKGFPLCPMPDLPFIHLDQRQRFGLPGYAGSESHNRQYFLQKHGEYGKGIGDAN